MVGADRWGVHEAVLVRHALRKPVDGGILVEVGVPRWPHDRRRRDRRRRAATAIRDLLAASEIKAEGESHCTMELESSGPAAKLSITHTIEREPSKLIGAVSGGWPKVISNLKSLLETGSAVLRDPYPIESAHQLQ